MNTASTTLASPPASPRRLYLALLSWAFTLFSTLRVVAYLPTLLAMVNSGDSNQHSLWTWFLFAGGNASMAAWIFENNGGKACRAVVVNTFNAVMCLLILGTAVVFRL